MNVSQRVPDIYNRQTVAGIIGDIEKAVNEILNVRLPGIEAEITFKQGLPQDLQQGATPKFAGMTLTSPLGTTSGGTGLSSYAQGDTLYASATDVLAKLGKTATDSYYDNSGAGNNPAWAAKAALTRVDDTNVTLTLGGTPATSLLKAVSVTVGWSGLLALTRGGTNANLTAANGGVVYSDASAFAINTPGSSGDWLKSIGAGAPAWTNPAALTKADDTNVTLTLGGSHATALLNAASITAGWTGQLGLTRGGTAANLTAAHGGVVYSTAGALAINTPGNSGDWLKSVGAGTPAWTAPAALTKADDTNVTLTLGGSASTALLNAASITAGWTGTLGVARGGTNIASYTVGDILYASAGTTLSVLAGVATGNALISGGVATAPSWGKIGLTTHISGTLPIANGGTNATTAADARTNLGLGTAATQNTGTSGANVPLLNGANTWSAKQNITLGGNGTHAVIGETRQWFFHEAGGTNAFMTTADTGGGQGIYADASLACFIVGGSAVVQASATEFSLTTLTAKFGSHSALGAETVTGYISIKDSGGTTRKLAVVS